MSARNVFGTGAARIDLAVPADLPFPRRRKLRRLGRKLYPYLFLIPTAALLAGIYLYPLCELVRTSLYDAHTMAGMRQFIGLANYRRVISGDLLDILWKTLVWAGISTPAAMVLGLSGALLLNHDFRGKNFLKLMAFVPWTIPHAMIAIFWKWLIHPYYGMANHLLLSLHFVDAPINFLAVKTALLTATGMRVWKGAPFALITLLAALQTIPREMYEAAEVDGAGPVRTFLSITFPMIRGIFLTTSLMITIWAVVTFDMLWVLTEGGPLGATEILPIAIYRRAFLLYRAGEACALGVIGMALVALLGVLYFFALKGAKE
jgi:multiple sugar transport system permease protein